MTLEEKQVIIDSVFESINLAVANALEYMKKAVEMVNTFKVPTYNQSGELNGYREPNKNEICYLLNTFFDQAIKGLDKDKEKEAIKKE